MKKLLLFALIILLGITINANPKTTINGSANLSDQSYEKLTINGSITVNNIIVKNYMIINGSMNGKNLTCKSLKSNGACDIDELKTESIISNGSFIGKNITVDNDSEFNGSSKISYGRLKTIKAAASKLILSDTVVSENIVFRKMNNSSKSFFADKLFSLFSIESKTKSPQILELRNKSVVAGYVLFEEGNGEIHLFDGSEVKGSVINGKIIKK